MRWGLQDEDNGDLDQERIRTRDTKIREGNEKGKYWLIKKLKLKYTCLNIEISIKEVAYNFPF